MAALSPAATLLHKHTYTLGRSLYIPLTCRCNSTPLPITRGPGFLLPKSIADALISVRNVECGEDRRLDGDGDGEERVAMPNFPKKWLVDCLYENVFEKSPFQRNVEQECNGSSIGVMDDKIRPSISTLIDEVISRLDSDSYDNTPPSPSFDQVVIAGEGEPTLRMDALLAVSRQIQSHRKERSEAPLPIRVITNGLVYTVPNFGYSPYNSKRNGPFPLHRHVVLRDMMEAGISRISVALNTANRHEYDVLMEPCCYSSGRTMPGTAHDMVCEFILEAAKVGMEVEITGIDRPDVDKVETDRLARLLLSVADKSKRSKVRWRKYFQ
ncbi:hypothetical protein HJC23_000310 [Cyclotella cryptica]|uniref:Radical SAM core domain-containing protein n=1 Tax=Cyclotella cryptica TaxID=29204 RepID=A0ABD3P2G0_9STRA|eukprot:CCRYP_018006-RA/>CCRYP_018006-RA protein AED:0.01 eAED:-0.00 QI:0/-1/0/1/-1/1/1/0/325